MKFYNNIHNFYKLVGNNVAGKANQTIDVFLNSLTDKYSNAGLILNHIKDSGVNGNTTIKTILSNGQYFGILDRALRLARLTDLTDLYQKTIKNYSQFTTQNQVVLNENDLTPAGLTGGTSFSYTNLVKGYETLIIKNSSIPSSTSAVDSVTKSYSLKGSVFLGETGTTEYVIPLGLVSLTGQYDLLYFGKNKNSVSASDSEFINVSTPFTPGCLVTDLNTDDVVGVDSAFIIADNSLLPDDYFLSLLVSSSEDLGSSLIHLDQEILIRNSTSDLIVEFEPI